MSVPSQAETIITAALILVKIENFHKTTTFSSNVILTLKRCRFFVVLSLASRQQNGDYRLSLTQDQRYTYRVLQTIQIKLILLCVWAEPAVLGSTKTALKFKYV